MQTLDYCVHVKLQAEVAYTRIKCYKGRWHLLPQYLVTTQKRIPSAFHGVQVLAHDE